jgi:hypothetical protein
MSMSSTRPRCQSEFSCPARRFQHPQHRPLQLQQTPQLRPTCTWRSTVVFVKQYARERPCWQQLLRARDLIGLSSSNKLLFSWAGRWGFSMQRISAFVQRISVSVKRLVVWITGLLHLLLRLLLQSVRLQLLSSSYGTSSALPKQLEQYAFPILFDWGLY